MIQALWSVPLLRLRDLTGFWDLRKTPPDPSVDRLVHGNIIRGESLGYLFDIKNQRSCTALLSFWSQGIA